nr:oligosaccharide flippase family protein [Desulfobacteraceae bacterium]
MNTIIKKLANQTVYYGLSSIVGRIINFFLVPLYVRIFTEGQYGIYTNIYAYFTFLNILYTYGMETTYFRFVNKEGDSRRVFSTTTASLTLTSLAFSLFIYLGRNGFTAAMGYAGHPEYAIWILIILALDTLAVSSFASLRYRERPIKFAFIKTMNILVNVAFNLFFLVFCPYVLRHDRFQALYSIIQAVYSPGIGIGYIFISNIIASLVTLLMLYKELADFNFDIDLGLLKRMLVYSAPLVVVGFAGMINDNLDRTILKHLLPYSDDQNDILLGIYGANAKLSVFMVLVIQAFKYAAEPFFFLQS